MELRFVPRREHAPEDSRMVEVFHGTTCVGYVKRTNDDEWVAWLKEFDLAPENERVECAGSPELAFCMAVEKEIRLCAKRQGALYQLYCLAEKKEYGD